MTHCLRCNKPFGVPIATVIFLEHNGIKAAFCSVKCLREWFDEWKRISAN